MEDAIEQASTRTGMIENEIKYWTEVLQKSEKYERLMQDSDFKDVLKDIEQTVAAHENEIKMCLDGMSEYTPKLEVDVWHSIRVHQILKEQAQWAMKRPQETIELAKQAREKIPALKKQLMELKETISHG
jgi:hypothetical protein